jgi:hypothetical protein
MWTLPRGAEDIKAEKVKSQTGHLIGILAEYTRQRQQPTPNLETWFCKSRYNVLQCCLITLAQFGSLWA